MAIFDIPTFSGQLGYSSIGTDWTPTGISKYTHGSIFVLSCHLANVNP